jgi:hypothetical protein
MMKMTMNLGILLTLPNKLSKPNDTKVSIYELEAA